MPENQHNGIKTLKPKIGNKSRYKQGYFDISKSAKYKNKAQPCIYRSSLEYRFMVWCENSSRVISWESEPFFVPYLCLETGKVRKYYIDFLFTTSKPETVFVEVKSHKEVTEAEKFGKIYSTLTDEKKKKSFVKANKTAAKNWSKWKHAQEIAKKRNSKFVIVTEKFFKSR